MNYILITTFLITTYFSAAHAEVLSVSAALDKLEELNGFEKEMHLSIESSELKVKSENSISNPQIQLSRGRVESQNNSGVYSSWSVSQEIEISGQKNVSIEKNAKLNDMSRIEYLLKRRQSESELLKNLYSIRSSEEHLKHLDERLASLNMVKRYLSNNKFISPKDTINKSLIENVFIEISIKKMSLVEEIKNKKQEVASLLNLSPDVSYDFKWPDLKLLSENIHKLPEIPLAYLKYNEAQSDYIEKEAKIRSREWIPNLNVSYAESKESMVGGNRNQNVSLGISVPIFNASRGLSRSGSKDREAEKIRQGRMRVHKTLMAQQARNEFNKKYSLLKLLQEKVIDRRESDIAKAAKLFKKGQIEALAFIELERQDHAYHEQYMEEMLNINNMYLDIFSYYPMQEGLKRVFYE